MRKALANYPSVGKAVGLRCMAEDTPFHKSATRIDYGERIPSQGGASLGAVGAQEFPPYIGFTLRSWWG